MIPTLIGLCMALAYILLLAMLVIVIVIIRKGYSSSRVYVVCLVLFMWTYMLNMLVLYSLILHSGAYSTGDAICRGILLVFSTVGFWQMSDDLLNGRVSEYVRVWVGLKYVLSKFRLNRKAQPPS